MVSNKKMNKKKINLIFIINVIATLGLIWVFFEYADFKSHIFWIAALIEIGIAFIVVYPQRWPILRLILLVSATVIPRYLSRDINSLQPIGFVWVILFIASLWIIYKRQFLEKQVTKGKKLIHGFILPTYLPSGFEQTDTNQYRKKKYDVVEFVYQNKENGYLIWIKESNGQIPDNKPYKNLIASDKELNKVPIHIEKEILKSKKDNNEPAFIVADWKYKNINFNLRSDGLSEQEFEKIISSMLVK